MAKTIVFCVDQAHAEEMRRALEYYCAEEVRRFPGYLARIVSDEGDEGKRALGRFGTPDEPLPVVVTTSKLLSTGVDVPTCKNIVLARPVGSMVEFKQIIGRGTRVHEKKQWFTIIDYAGATHHFFDQEFDGDPELVEVEPITPAAPPAAAAPAAAGAAQDDRLAAAPAAAIAAASDLPTRAEAALVETPTPAGMVKDGPVGYAQGEPGAAAEALPLRPADAPGAQPGQPAAGSLDAQARERVAAPASSQGTSAPAAQAKNSSGEPLALPPMPPAGAPTIQTGSGRRIVVIGEIVYELGPDGSTLRVASYQDYTRDALEALCATAAELRARWLQPAQREEIKERLTQEGVDLGQLAERLRLADADPFDLLLHVAFGERPLTRRERADRLKREHAAFFGRYGPAAREILETILEKYLAGEAEDVSNTELLRVPPLSGKGTFMELARRFGGGDSLRAALKELQTRLYSA